MFEVRVHVVVSNIRLEGQTLVRKSEIQKSPICLQRDSQHSVKHQLMSLWDTTDQI